MIHKFEFATNNALQLDIAGHIYTIDVMDASVVKKMQEFSKEAIEKGNALMECEDYEKALLEACAFCGRAIDEILGEGAYKKIFKNRTINIIDHIDLINFIAAKITEFRAERFSTYSPNRTVRRAKK